MPVDLLMLNWRYVDHPQSGGAEILTHAILMRLAAAGHKVTCFTAEHPGAPRESVLDGVRVVRRGVQWTVHVHAWRWLRSRTGDFDRIVDQINTIPFLTPLYVDAAKRTYLIHQLARGYWFRETRGAFRLFSPIGYATEPLLLQAYRHTPGATISESTAADLRRLGLRRPAIIPPAAGTIPVDPLPPAPREPGSRLVVVGRLTPAKHVEDTIAALEVIAGRRPDAHLDIVGSGDPVYRRRLETLARGRGVLGRLTFHGRVSEDEKRRLLGRADLHLFASRREGWGLTVTEAAVLGTPTVGYDAPGVRDSVADPRCLAPRGDSDALARRALDLLGDEKLYATIRTEAWNRGRALTYERATRAFADAVGVPLD